MATPEAVARIQRRIVQRRLATIGWKIGELLGHDRPTAASDAARDVLTTFERGDLVDAFRIVQRIEERLRRHA